MADKLSPAEKRARAQAEHKKRKEAGLLPRKAPRKGRPIAKEGKSE